jgi:uncharacterized protein
MLSIDDFSPVNLESKPLFDSHYKKYPPVHSDNVFTTMVAWNAYAHYEYAFIDNALFLKTRVNDIIQFRPPIGNINKEQFDMLLKMAKSEGTEYPLAMITDGVKEWMMRNYGSLTFIAQTEYADYVYLSSNLAHLKGSDYRKIRNRLNKFIKNIAYKMEFISDDNINEVKMFLKRWCIWKDCEDDPLLNFEKKAVLYSINHFKELGLSGIAIRVNDRIEAISVFEQMNPETVVVHFEKGSPDYDGIYKLINRETALYIEKNASFINRESDMGNPGLRKAKLSYRPDHMVEVYEINRDELFD